jgi:hypothetical protein
MKGLPIRQTDQADDAIGRQHARGRVFVAGGFRALDIVHGLDEVVDAERDRGNEDDAEELEARKNLAEGRDRHREAEIGEGVAKPLQAQAAEPEPEQVGAPGNQHARRDRHQACRNGFGVFHAAEPARDDDDEANEADLRRHVHF